MIYIFIASVRVLCVCVCVCVRCIFDTPLMSVMLKAKAKNMHNAFKMSKMSQKRFICGVFLYRINTVTWA